MKLKFDNRGMRDARGRGGRIIFRPRDPVVRPARRGRMPAFTLIEVIVAVALFFMAMFSILALVSRCVDSAYSLQKNGPTAGMVIANFSTTNKLVEDFETGDFGEVYPDYTWARQVDFFASNGLFMVSVAVLHKGQLDSKLSTLLYRPDSSRTRMDRR